MRSHLNSKNDHHQKNLQTINAGEDVEKRELSCTAGRNVNWYNHYGEQYGDFFKGDLPDPGIKPRSPALHTDSLLSETPGKPEDLWTSLKAYFIKIYDFDD